MSKRAILSKVTALLEKRAEKVGIGLSFRVILEGSEDDELYRTRGYKPHDPSTFNTTVQTTEDKTND